MDVLVHVVTYAALVVFVAAVAVRFFRIRNYPINLRWEIYPVPHEGEKAEYGGSKMEETDFWARQHKPDKLTELKFMLAEMVFIKGLYEHNRKLWYRSFPFHFGLYVLAAFAGLLVFGAILEQIGLSFVDGQMSGFAAHLNGLTAAVGLIGFVLAIAGSVGLLLMRLTDDDLKPYTNTSHIFNLLFLLVALLLALAAFAFKQHLLPWRQYIGSLITFKLAADIGGPLTVASIVAVSLLIAYIPLTHMSHFFVKWFTWHKIRWDDTPNVKGGRIEKLIEQALQYPVSWSANHIQGGGTKTWAQVATEEMSDSE